MHNIHFVLPLLLFFFFFSSFLPKNDPHFSGGQLTRWCWRKKLQNSVVRSREILNQLCDGKRMMPTCQEEGKDIIHVENCYMTTEQLGRKRHPNRTTEHSYSPVYYFHTYSFYICEPRSWCLIICQSPPGFYCHSFIEFSHKCPIRHSIYYPQLSAMLKWPFPGLPFCSW